MNFLGYIDPGTGSMLFTVIIGIVTTLFFVLRGVFIKFKFVLHGGNVKEDKNKLPCVIFSDSKRYWNVFKPICDEMEKRGFDAEYWTASPDDPALQETYEHIKCKFIGEGNKAFARLNVMNAWLCLSTTPGLDVLQWKRSKDTNWYVHVFHALDDATMYRQFGLDYYDAVLLNGQIQAEKTRQLEQMRNLPAKEFETVGSAYLDNLLKKRNAYRTSDMQQNDNKTERTILCAPTWGASSILNRFGESFVQALVDTGYKIIVRPHPQSKTADAELLKSLQEKFPEGDKMEWNYDNDNFEVLSRSDIMISDFSGVIFDFCYIFDRPVIYADTDYDKSPYDADWFEGRPWLLETLPRLGKELKKEDLPQMKKIIDEVLADDKYRAGREESRHEAWEHEGEAVVRIVDYLEKKKESLTAE